MSRLTQAQKDEWVKRLRSGKYAQGQGFLHRRPAGGATEYCCLGVLSRVCGVKVRDMEGRSTLGAVGLEGLLHRSEEESLTRQNDIYEKSFFEIAYWIEKNLWVQS